MDEAPQQRNLERNDILSSPLSFLVRSTDYTYAFLTSLRRSTHCTWLERQAVLLLCDERMAQARKDYLGFLCIHLIPASARKLVNCFNNQH